MIMDELDRILGSEQPLQPSSGLADSIMEAVRQEARQPEPIRFPWGWFIPAIIAAVTILVAGLMVAVQHGLPVDPGPGVEEVKHWMLNPATHPWGWVLGSLLVCYLAWKLPSRLGSRA